MTDTSTNLLDGVLWPWMPLGDDSLPWVERDDDSERFDTDDEAAYYVADLIGGTVMYAMLVNGPITEDERMEGEVLVDPLDRDNLRPFVIPRPDVGIGTPSFDRWLTERDAALKSIKNRRA